MEINEPLDSEIHSLDVTPESRAYLLEAAKWGRFVAIVSFVFLGLFALMFLFMGGTMMSVGLGNEMGGMGMLGGVGAFLYIAFIFALMFFPSYYMYSFSIRTITAINSTSTLDLTEGLKNLKSLFKFYGIMMAILVGIYALMFVFAGGAALLM